ncbi:MAG: histidine kinase [Chitinophagaceae bacterium]
MSNTRNKAEKGFFSKNLYLVLAAAASVPVFIITNVYVNGIGIHEDEATSTGTTAIFIAGVFTGRYIAGIWAHGRKSIPNSYLTGLVILLVAAGSWLFFHADFPLQGRASINFFLFLLPLILISIVLGMLIKMARIIAGQQLEEARAGEAHSKSELHLLQSQLSPHFLFNTLNNLYGLSITQHEKVPALLLKLSELLRYSVYDATDIFSPLKDEIAYINNYIDFEKIRIGDRLMLTTAFEEITDSGAKIAPMLLIVFVENAFKHAKNTADDKIFIEITLRTWGDSILFSVRNSQRKLKDDNVVTNKNSGFGLPSVNKRLELLYHNQHDLTVEDKETFYHVMLRLKIK